MKKITLLALTFFSLTMISCSIPKDSEKVSSKFSKLEVQELMEKHIETKYNSDFKIDTPIITGDKSYGPAKSYRSTAYKIGEEDKIFNIKIDINDSSLILDNYETFLYQQAAIDIYQKIANDFWSNNIVDITLNLPALCEYSSIHGDAMDYLLEENPRALTRIYIGIDTYDSQKESQTALNFMKKLNSLGLYGEIQFIYVNNLNFNDKVSKLSKVPDGSIEGDTSIIKYRYLYMKPNEFLEENIITTEFNK